MNFICQDILEKLNILPGQLVPRGILAHGPYHRAGRLVKANGQLTRLHNPLPIGLTALHDGEGIFLVKPLHSVKDRRLGTAVRILENRRLLPVAPSQGGPINGPIIGRIDG